MIIGLIGQVSSGKSSLTNALLGKFVSPVSLGRETIRPRHYHVWAAPDTADPVSEKALLEKITLGKLSVEDKALLARPFKISITSPAIADMQIIDFAGLNDTEDNNGAASNDIFLESFMKNLLKLDIILFITNAFSPLVHSSEFQLFTKIQNAIKTNNEVGRWQKLVLICNKYDNHDDEVDELIKKVIEKTNVENYFKLSAHKFAAKITIKQFPNGALEWVKREWKKFQYVTSKDTKNESNFMKYLCSQNIQNERINLAMKCFDTRMKLFCTNNSTYATQLYEIINIIIELPVENSKTQLIQSLDKIIIEHNEKIPQEYLLFIAVSYTKDIDNIAQLLKLLPNTIDLKYDLKLIYNLYIKDYVACARFFTIFNKYERSVNIIRGLEHIIPKWDPSIITTSYIDKIQLAKKLIAKLFPVNENDPADDNINVQYLIKLMPAPEKAVFMLMFENYERVFADILIDPNHYYDKFINAGNTKITEDKIKELRKFIVEGYVLNNKRGLIYKDILPWIISVYNEHDEITGMQVLFDRMNTHY